MAILYVRTVKDPSGAGPFPPAVLETAWYTNIKDESVKTTVKSEFGHVVTYYFADVTALNTFLDQFRCTNATVKGQIQEWNTAHGITIYHDYYELTPASGLNPVGLTGNLSGQSLD
jgi:hypothetical protein